VGSHGALTVGVDALGTAVEGGTALVLAAQGAAVLLELVHADGRQGRRAMMLSRVVVDFVDGHRSVDDLGLDDFLVDDRLDGLVNVVVDMLALDDRGASLGVSSIFNNTLVTQFGLLCLQCSLCVFVVAMVELSVDDSTNIVLVLLGQDLLVMDGLDLVVIMVLMNFLVNCRGDLLVAGRLDRLVLNGRSNLLMDGRVMVARLVQKVLDCCLGLVHFGDFGDLMIKQQGVVSKVNLG